MHPAPRVRGKFLDVGGRRFPVKGVAYGTFAPDAIGEQFPAPARVRDDFAAMAAAGINTVRTYTVPPARVLDEAAAHGLRVMAGVPWAQHLAFLDDASLAREIRRDVVAATRRLAAHPATLLVAVGNEIPPGVVRWHGHRRVERFLRSLYDAAKDAAPDALLTYVNFPPTEYLDVEAFDVCAFNVYLHREADLRAYLQRLQHIAGQKPLLLAEAGADSLREGLDGQARITATHVRTAFAEGAAGAVAFAWTDEWWRGGHDVRDWAFGLVDADRRPKPALTAVGAAFADAPFAEAERAVWPVVSVVVCAYNAADTLEDCLTSLAALTYPRVEVIVVDDGSTDATAAIARRAPGVTVLSVPNGGLSAARNVGLARATGEIVAYTDADVRVDPDWLTFLVQPMLSSGVAGSGGPNVVPHDDPWVAQAVARAPGGPTHVLLDDRIAEHVPGCNMAFRKDALAAIGGFNPVFLRAGDDVDICWRLQASGRSIGFAPAALVWHHHRRTVRAYWRQQVGYGEGEIWLDAHHPEKFLSGQALWRGRIYSPLPFVRSLAGRRVNSGVWGTAAFPSVYSTDCHPLQFLPHSPAWMGGATLLLLAGLAGLLAHPGDAAVLLAGLGAGAWAVTVWRCLVFAWRSDLGSAPAIGTWSRWRTTLAYRALIAWLHLLQPIARARGRLRGLLSPPAVAPAAPAVSQTWKAPVPSPWSAKAAARLQVGGTAVWSFWSETWIDKTAVLAALTSALRASRPAPRVDVDDGWHADRDVSLAIGRWGWLHVRALVEEHAEGRCLLRVAARLQPSVRGMVGALALAALAMATTSAAIALRWPWVSAAAVAGAALTLTAAAWQTTRSVAVVDRGLARVASRWALLPMAGAAAGARVTWRPTTALHKSQATMFLALLATSALVGGFVLSQDLAPVRTAAPRPAVAPPLVRPVPGRDAEASAAPARLRAAPAAKTGGAAPRAPVRRAKPRSPRVTRDRTGVPRATA
ncbi:MAG: glycosyltransferase [Vicinamibacterales bacterium]